MVARTNQSITLSHKIIIKKYENWRQKRNIQHRKRRSINNAEPEWRVEVGGGGGGGGGGGINTRGHILGLFIYSLGTTALALSNHHLLASIKSIKVNLIN